MADTMELYYFPIRGRAEPLRMCLAAAGKPFKDMRVTGEQWAKEKEKAPYGQMPFIVYKGKSYGESKALASFLARECGLAGQTSEEAMRVDEVFCLTTNLLAALGNAYLEKDEAKKAAMEKELAEETIPKYLGFFEKLLKESGTGYFVGKGLTLADISVQDITYGLVKKNPQLLDGFPEIQRMVKNVEGDKNIMAYLKSRPVTEM